MFYKSPFQSFPIVPLFFVVSKTLTTHSNKFSIYFICKTKNEHMIFLTIHCNIERQWKPIISKPNVMIVLVEFSMNHCNVQKPSLWTYYIHTTLGPILCFKDKGISWWCPLKESGHMFKNHYGGETIHQHPLLLIVPNIICSMTWFL